MPSAAIEVAEVLLAELQGRSWTQAVEFERTWLPRTFVGDGTRTQLENLLISIVPAVEKAEVFTRENDYDACTIDVGFRRYVGREAGIQGDSVVHLVSDVSKSLKRWEATLPSGRSAQLAERETISTADPETLETKGIMTSVLRLTINVYE